MSDGLLVLWDDTLRMGFIISSAREMEFFRYPAVPRHPNATNLTEVSDIDFREFIKKIRERLL